MKITALWPRGPTGSSEPAKKGDISPAQLLLYDCRVRPNGLFLAIHSQYSSTSNSTDPVEKSVPRMTKADSTILELSEVNI